MFRTLKTVKRNILGQKVDENSEENSDIFTFFHDQTAVLS